MGNQLLEAIIVKRPVILFEYEIFLSDIKSSGLEYVNLGNKYNRNGSFIEINESVLEKASEKSIEILFDREKYYNIVNKNFEIGKKEFSFETLKRIIKEIIFSS
ncbi:hypothetical protein [Marinitoga lauensis]|uniref:hypothetical protein n=1 Tax=Marinitoga lauensis TaxID=2201189 RepID=UPI0019807ABA|nr:hypothetical protein [Marinitoga lauensis]